MHIFRSWEEIGLWQIPTLIESVILAAGNNIIWLPHIPHFHTVCVCAHPGCYFRFPHESMRRNIYPLRPRRTNSRGALESVEIHFPHFLSLSGICLKFHETPATRKAFCGSFVLGVAEILNRQLFGTRRRIPKGMCESSTQKISGWVRSLVFSPAHSTEKLDCEKWRRLKSFKRLLMLLQRLRSFS